MNKEEIKNFLRAKPGYLKFGPYKLSIALDAKEKDCMYALADVRSEFRNKPGSKSKSFKVTLDKDWSSSRDVFKDAFNNKGFFPIDSFKEVKVKKVEGKNVLVIGDLHEPFCLEGYLQHCIETYKQYKCNEVVFIGDIIDNHATSYHETDPDGHNAGQELKLAVSNIQKWYQAFPKATVIIGNHDRLIMRKAYTAGVSKMWIKDYADVLGTPNWTFTESIEIDDVLYIHGEGGTARTRARRDLQSIVQGHLHTQMYIDWIVGKKFKIFAVQVGCGVNHETYAMTYAKEFAKPAIGCAVILNGKLPISIPMEL